MRGDAGADVFIEDGRGIGDDFGGFWSNHPRFDSVNNGRRNYFGGPVKGGVWQNFWESRNGTKGVDLNPRFSTEDLLTRGCVFAFLYGMGADG